MFDSSILLSLIGLPLFGMILLFFIPDNNPDLQKNVGQTKAILAGMAHSDGDIVVLMDDDLQHSPSDIPELISPICSGRVDCSIASFSTKKHSLFRNLGSRLVRFTYRRLHSLPSKIVMSSFRSFTRDVNWSLYLFYKN